MAGNFEFLKNKNEKLFNIINDAERLYRDGYFEQSIIQVRKFAENICKITLGVRRTTEETFDEMLATLKDILGNGKCEKEFIDDMYFIKKEGNLAAHGSVVEQGGTVALECLKRAFELSINFAIKNNFANKKILNSHYSIDMLMTGKKPKYTDNYQQLKEESIKEIVEKAQDDEEQEENDKTIEIDFKNKKRVNKKTKTSSKKNKTTVSKEKKNKNISKKNTKEKISYENIICAIGTGILLILLIGIIIFILPF